MSCFGRWEPAADIVDAKYLLLSIPWRHNSFSSIYIFSSCTSYIAFSFKIVFYCPLKTNNCSRWRPTLRSIPIGKLGPISPNFFATPEPLRGCQRASRNCTQSRARIVNLTTSLYQCRHLSPPVICPLGHLGIRVILVILVTSSMVVLVGRNSPQSIPSLVN